MKRTLILLVLVLITQASFALTPNIPAGTLTPDFGIITRLGTFQHAINYGPIPRIPPGAVPQRWRGQGVVILDLSVRTGYVDFARIWQSTGVKEIDDALIATLQHWRVQPRIAYKLYVPVTISAGSVRLGSDQPL
jgi:outer membrane biosynthesis protein TonB